MLHHVLSLPGMFALRIKLERCYHLRRWKSINDYLLNNVKLSIPEDKLVHSVIPEEAIWAVHHVEPV